MAPERVNRRDQIVEVASRLFMEQGYATTSVRQIADEVGCTEAALYYHFKDGKRELLQEALECNLPDLAGEVEASKDAETLYDFLKQFISRMVSTAQDRMEEKVRWVMAEFPKLNADERELMQRRNILFRDTLFDEIKRFVPDDEVVERIGWSLMFTLFGYGQMMVVLDMQSYMDFDVDQFIEFTARRLSAGY